MALKIPLTQKLHICRIWPGNERWALYEHVKWGRAVWCVSNNFKLLYIIGSIWSLTRMNAPYLIRGHGMTNSGACLPVRPRTVLLSCHHQGCCLQPSVTCTVMGKQWPPAVVQQPRFNTFCCALFASAEPDLLGVVDKEQKMHNLYILSHRGSPLGCFLGKNIAG